MKTQKYKGEKVQPVCKKMTTHMLRLSGIKPCTLRRSV